MLNKLTLKQFPGLTCKFPTIANRSPSRCLAVPKRPLATLATANDAVTPADKPSSFLTEEEYGEVESEYTDTPEYPEDVPSIYDHKSLKRIAYGRKV